MILKGILSMDYERKVYFKKPFRPKRRMKMNKEDRINDMLNMETRMSKWKQPQSLDFVYGATSRYSFVNWQTGNDESIYYNLNLPAFFKTQVVMPPAETSILERDLHPELLDISFNNLDGTCNPTLEEYIIKGQNKFRP